MKAYCVKYRLYECGEVKEIMSLAKNRGVAYDKAVYELIPEKDGTYPYCAWVESVTYNNGNHKVFYNLNPDNPY